MSAREVTDEVLAGMANYDLIILNFANPGYGRPHRRRGSGNQSRGDGRRMRGANYSKLSSLTAKPSVTADHGNCERCAMPTVRPTPRTPRNLVHFVYVANDAARFRCEDGILADVAPTLLFLLGLPQPKEMTGHNLLVNFQKERVSRALSYNFDIAQHDLVECDF